MDPNTHQPPRHQENGNLSEEEIQIGYQPQRYQASGHPPQPYLVNGHPPQPYLANGHPPQPYLANGHPPQEHQLYVYEFDDELDQSEEEEEEEEVFGYRFSVNQIINGTCLERSDPETRHIWTTLRNALGPMADLSTVAIARRCLGHLYTDIIIPILIRSCTATPDEFAQLFHLVTLYSRRLLSRFELYNQRLNGAIELFNRASRGYKIIRFNFPGGPRVFSAQLVWAPQ